MNKKLDSILTQLKSAYRITVDDSYGECELNVDFGTIFNEDSHTVIDGEYIDTDDETQYITINEGRLKEAEIVNGGFLIIDDYGIELTLRMYSNPQIAAKQDW